MLFNAVSVVCGLAVVATAKQMPVTTTDTANFELTKFEPCDPAIDYPIQMKAAWKKGGDNVQLMTSSGDFKVPFGEDSDYNVTIERKNTKEAKTFTPLFTVYEKNACEAIKKYLGEFIFGIQKASGIEPGTCPVPKGSYGVTDYPLDFKKLAFQSFPEGVLTSRHVMTNVNTKEVLMCFVAEVENFPK